MSHKSLKNWENGWNNNSIIYFIFLLYRYVSYSLFIICQVCLNNVPIKVRSFRSLNAYVVRKGYVSIPVFFKQTRK